MVEIAKESHQARCLAGLRHPVEMEGGQTAVDAPLTQVLTGSRGKETEGLERVEQKVNVKPTVTSLMQCSR